MSMNPNAPHATTPYQGAGDLRPLPREVAQLDALQLAPRAPLLSGCHALLSYCSQLGLDLTQLVQEAGIDAALVNNLDANLCREARLKLWRLARAVSKDALLHLHVAEAAPFGAYRIADFLCATAPTAGVALCKLASLLATSDISASVSVVEEGDCASILLRPGSQLVEVSQDEAEYVLAVCYLRTRLATGLDLMPLGLDIVGPAGQDEQEVARVFGCRPTYRRPLNRLWFRRTDLERENVRADPALFSLLETRIAEAQAARASDDPVLAAVRRVVMEDPSSAPLIERTARKLGMSARSLQRRLRASGTTFSQVLEEARAQYARKLLVERESSLNEIAGALGFSEHSAFSRAFKRWTGDTPSRFRVR